jgi:hypothetical protein
VVAGLQNPRIRQRGAFRVKAAWMDLIAIGEEANAMDAEIIARMNEVFSR